MKDLTKGKISTLILGFAIPVFLGNLLQLTYSLADTRIVGRIGQWICNHHSTEIRCRGYKESQEIICNRNHIRCSYFYCYDPCRNDFY